MKIVHLFPGKIWGGAEQYVLDLGKALIAQGNEVKFIARDTEAVRGRLQREPGIEVTYVDKVKSGTLAPHIAEADVLHIHDINTAPIAVKARKKSQSNVRIVVTRHIARASRLAPWLRSRVKQIDGLIFVSNLGRTLWSGVNKWFPAEKSKVVLNSIAPASDAGGDSLREVYGIDEQTPLLVFTGRVRRSKGCETIINSLSLLRDKPFRMVFVGACKPSDYVDTLKALSEKHVIGERVIFHGFADNVASLIKGADIGLSPSIVREACPLSPLEYMAQGIPVIVSDNGGQIEYTRNGENGLIVPPADEQALAKAIGRLIDSAQLRHEIGSRAKANFAYRLSYEAFVDNIIAVYNALA